MNKIFALLMFTIAIGCAICNHIDADSEYIVRDMNEIKL